MRALVLVTLVGCYSPKLGGEPFFCGSGTPACPDGYSCQADATSGKMICVAAGGAVVDAAKFSCNDDSTIEGPNGDDTIANAFQTPVALNRSTVMYTMLAICPASDKDFFRVDLKLDPQNIEAIVTYDDPTKPGAGPLLMEIDNQSGTTVALAMPVSGATNTIRAYGANLAMASSPYFVQIKSDGAHENNYTLQINTTP